ncbi:MAG: acetyl-CoA C-acetyltransferase [Rhodobacteraceae bacterium]|nr:acetyl-CoA C-acetyltransferase [Paracoccaceae bacterium]MCY4249467.1 acetyl-CoA C-acetyltransferase [Paracoccaceae bacterium]
MEAFIYDSVRTPRGKGKKDGSLHEVTSVWLSAFILNKLLERAEIDHRTIDDLIWGNVTQVGEQGGCLARSAVLYSKLDDSIPGLAINRFCASGLEAVNLAANQIRGNAGTGYIAGGVEMLSRVPMGSDGAALLVDPTIAMNHSIIPQGVSADLMATKYGFSRSDCDQYAVESQRRAEIAWKEKRFDKSVIPVVDDIGATLLEVDEHLRPDTNLAALEGLDPSFQQIGEVMPGFDKVALLKYPELESIHHVHHAGNSSGIVDGAAALLIGSVEFGQINDMTPRARIVTTAKSGSEPTIMLSGPIPASEKALKQASLNINDIDLFEVNEAFSSVPLRFVQHFDLDPEMVNVNGGAIAMGHPLGATGAMILGTLLDELERSDKTLGLATLCVAGGMGVTTIIENL